MEKEKKKFWDTKVGSILQSVAPIAVDIIGDTIPGGELVKSLFNTFVTKKLTDPTSPLTTEQLETIAARSQEFELALIEYESKERDALLADRADARNLAKSMVDQTDIFTKRFLPWLSIISIFLALTYIFLITFIAIPESSQRFADTILGVVISLILTTIYQFWFGSSIGSKTKDQK